ncbi:hypothetical protein [Massilia orientalis]|uniref:Uncharacterized protein n=1 Tax=Massilia orientalis TaxID=3050128 RepID=A0ACC7MFI0_9BURK|nr:hypothetical protein [Massilia sp. YIM B02787]
MRLTEVTVCEIILPKDNKMSIFCGVSVSDVHQNSVDSIVENDYEDYLRQRSLNAVLTTSAVISSIWFAVGIVFLAVGVWVWPAANAVGMDPAGREHPLTVIKVPAQASGAKQ